ncbi:hypothetical protein MPER_16292, partial [Moniliophthora perniciosa FA553]
HDHSAKLVAAKQLKQPLTIRVPYSDEGEEPSGKEYTLTIKFIQQIDTSALEQYNLILAAHPTRSTGGGVMVGRNRFFFPTVMQAADLGGGL